MNDPNMLNKLTPQIFTFFLHQLVLVTVRVLFGLKGLLILLVEFIFLVVWLIVLVETLLEVSRLVVGEVFVVLVVL